MTNWIEAVTGSLEQKKQYRRYKARMEALAAPYDVAAKALHRYLMYYGGVVDGETSVTMMGDLVELWERAAVDGTPVREIVGRIRSSSPRPSRRRTAVCAGSIRSVLA